MPSANHPLRIILADDQTKVRSALRLMIGQHSTFCVVGEAGSASELLRETPITHAQVVLLDWELPGLSETHILHPLRSLVPSLCIIALSGKPEARTQALAEGADMFISKSDPPESVLDALYSIKVNAADRSETHSAI
jgi:DNA-binding NarL/FixJ family response regulator